MSSVSEAVQRLKAIFLEMPGTQLSVAAAARLSGVESDRCCTILAALEDARFLSRSRSGLFIRRATDSPLSD
jgi:hypothetical protein